MGQIFFRPLIGSVLAMTLGLGTGCSHWIELAAPTDAVTPAGIGNMVKPIADVEGSSVG